jgi:UDP-4-amino-4,6-dideoxy-N-acetyl-beta-L-altrosamine transaminase
VVNVLQSDFLTQGPKVPAFERAVAEKVGAKHAVAVNSGTGALHVACLALGLGPGDILWTSPITFVASANCALYCGAGVDFVDIDPHTYTMCPKALEEKLEQAKKENRLPKIVIPVHLCGQPCNMKAIFDLSQKYGFKIIEDACHALGGEYKGSPIGNCRYSDITVFSFHPVKIITTGEGGMNTTNDADLASKMARLCSHGITRDPEFMTSAPEGPWYYQQIELGFNYRMTDIHAALGLSQLGKLDKFITRRRELAQRYDKLLANLPITTPWQAPDGLSAWHLYVIHLQLDKINQTHEQVFVALREKGIGVNLHYIPVHTQPWYQKLGFETGQFPKAEQYYREAITLPLFPSMTNDEQNEVVRSLEEILQP